MDHGISGYFSERARFSRRVSLLALAVSLLGFSALGLARMPRIQQVIRDTTRFGFEGRDQFVRRISLQLDEGRSAALSDLGQIAPRQTRKGGATRQPRGLVGTPVPRARASGPGTADLEMAIRSSARSANVPVVRSEDLVIDRLVKPEYPSPLLDRNIEGKVTLQALVDTVGRVVEVQLMSSTGEALFERAAEDAVWQCRFQPYRPGGVAASEVYAVFRFAFRIY